MIRVGLVAFFLISLHVFQPSRDFILSPDTQGVFQLAPEIRLTVGFGTVEESTRLVINQVGDELRLDMQPAPDSTTIPMLLEHNDEISIIDSPSKIAPVPEGQYLIYFDTIGVFAQHETRREVVYLLGMIEGYRSNFPVNPTRFGWEVEDRIESPGLHVLVITESGRGERRFLTASRIGRYMKRFAGQNLGHPATFRFLGWADAGDLPAIIRAMYSQIPANPPPPPGISLWLPFDCQEDWIVSWGYHFNTPQNRYAVDFTVQGEPNSAKGLPVRAAHAGTVYLKVFAVGGGYLDLGIAARVVQEDGITSTVYGHLHEDTLIYWDTTAEQIGTFEWIEVGQVDSGGIIGYVGTSGYITGAHIHMVLWTIDQSLYRPVFEGLPEPERGITIPAVNRGDCARY